MVYETQMRRAALNWLFSSDNRSLLLTVSSVLTAKCSCPLIDEKSYTYWRTQLPVCNSEYHWVYTSNAKWAFSPSFLFFGDYDITTPSSSFPFLPPGSLTYLHLVLFFFPCCCRCVCVCVYKYICAIFSACRKTHTYVFRTDRLVLDTWWVSSSLREPIFTPASVS